MKKAYNTIQYGIFIDNKKAYIVGIDEKNKLASETIKPPQAQMHFKGETTNKTGMLGHTLNRQQKQQNQAHLYFSKFCKTIAGRLKKANQLIIFGPSDAKYILHRELEKVKSLKHLYVVLRKTEPQTRIEAERYVKQFYKI